MSRIHLIENEGSIKKVDEKTWESGDWAVTEGTAKKLIDGSILFHKKQAQPSFFGGVIEGYRVQEEGKSQGRIIFSFRYSADCRQVSTERSGWRNEMKIVL